MKNYMLAIGVMSTVVLLAGCAHQIQPYRASVKNLDQLHTLKATSHPIKLASFIDTKAVKSLTCRAEGTETLPNNEDYVSYIKGALSKELQHAGLLSDSSSIHLDATLNNVSFSSMHGIWNIAMTFNDHRQSPYVVSSKYTFKTNYVADIACTEVANAFIPATQNFLDTLYHNKKFKKTLNMA